MACVETDTNTGSRGLPDAVDQRPPCGDHGHTSAGQSAIIAPVSSNTCVLSWLRCVNPVGTVQRSKRNEIFQRTSTHCLYAFLLLQSLPLSRLAASPGRCSCKAELCAFRRQHTIAATRRVLAACVFAVGNNERMQLVVKRGTTLAGGFDCGPQAFVIGPAVMPAVAGQNTNRVRVGDKYGALECI